MLLPYKHNRCMLRCQICVNAKFLYISQRNSDWSTKSCQPAGLLSAVDACAELTSICRTGDEFLFRYILVYNSDVNIPNQKRQ